MRQGLAKAGLRIDHSVPARRLVCRRQQLARAIAEALDDVGVKLRAAPLPRYSHGCVDAAPAVEDLNDVCELD